MAKNDKNAQARPPEAVISIIGVGMTLTGDCETDGALRVEGTIHGNVRAGKSVVIGKEGTVDGNIFTQDAIISGRVLGSVHAQSRLELQSTCQISGEIQAPRMQLEEGASVQGQVAVGDAPPPPQPKVGSNQAPDGGSKGVGKDGEASQGSDPSNRGHQTAAPNQQAPAHGAPQGQPRVAQPSSTRPV